MTSTVTTTSDVQRYLADRHSFRREQIILPDGRTLGEAEEPWQREHIFAPMDAVGADGRWLYRLLYLELARGHAKSTVAAAEAITVAVLERDWRIYIGAGDQDQAGITFEILRGMIGRNPQLRRSFRLGKFEAKVLANGSVIKVLSSDAATTYGLGGIGRGYLFLADELWQWRGRELWDALWTATGKVPDWRAIVLSNAGFDFKSIAWQVREIARQRPWGYLYAPDGPVASWLTSEWREMQRDSLPPEVYQRLIENKWVEGAGSFITRDMLAGCIDRDRTPRLAGDPDAYYTAGLDLGLKKDRTALAVTRFDRERDTVTLEYLRVWQGSKSSPVSIAEVEDELLSLSERFNLRKIALDPWQLQSTLQRLGHRLPVKEWNFSAESVRRLSETLFTLLKSGRLRLYPDADLERELLALNVVQKGYGWRIDHASGGYSDRAMALGMACVEALANAGGGFNIRWIPAPNEVGWT